MDRRNFLKSSMALAAATAMPEITQAKENKSNDTVKDGKLIISAPMLQNYAATSIGIAFAVSDMANGYVHYSEHADMSEAKTQKCGGYRVTDMNDKVMLVRLTNLKPATKYYYTIGADRISYLGGYKMSIISSEKDPRVYSFTTAGAKATGHFCVINDTHAHMEPFDLTIKKVLSLAPSCVIWNGDATNCEEDIDKQVNIFLTPDITHKDYASELPFIFCPGNHDSRGMANRHIERVLMFRQPEERSSRDWDLGRNFAIRMGDIAMIGLDTAEDKQDTNPLFAGLFSSGAYREAQVAWLKDALKQKEIASAPYLVAFCHIPLFDTDPTHNPGDVAPADKDPQYSTDYASWQRTCAKLWTPLLEKAGCQLIVTAHMHAYRYDAPTANRKWGQLVGGGWRLNDNRGFPTVIEGFVKDKKLHVVAHRVDTNTILNEFTFDARK